MIGCIIVFRASLPPPPLQTCSGHSLCVYDTEPLSASINTSMFMSKSACLCVCVHTVGLCICLIHAQSTCCCIRDRFVCVTCEWHTHIEKTTNNCTQTGFFLFYCVSVLILITQYGPRQWFVLPPHHLLYICGAVISLRVFLFSVSLSFSHCPLLLLSNAFLYPYHALVSDQYPATKNLIYMACD